VDDKRVLLFSLDLEKDAKKKHCTQAQLERLAQNRDGWRKLVSDLCPAEGQ
jgi:hypothetical protein